MRIILVRRRRAWALAAAAAALVLLAAGGEETVTSAMGEAAVTQVVVVDPGHGGEDGGAVAGDGTAESGLNLAVALRVRALLGFLGYPSVMTREEDVSIHDPDADTLREKKASDLRNRVELVNALPGAVLVSIHQNSLPSVPSVHGAQVFYNTADGADRLAECIQDALNGTVNSGNEKNVRPISPDIYLMKYVTAPAALVECGFLSNGEETALLCQPSYQTALAAAVAAGVASWGTGEEDP